MKSVSFDQICVFEDEIPLLPVSNVGTVSQTVLHAVHSGNRPTIVFGLFV